jgi:DNA invertase Pin-like site-specific DNA recombinase
MKNTVAIYARVSTDRQTVDLQIHELKEYIERRGWKIYREYIDQGFTGSDTRRPAFKEMMKAARKKQFDILLVWKLDRLSRSVQDLVNTIGELEALHVDFISYDNNLDTSTPQGKLLFHVIGAMAEFERAIMRERVKAGLENAKRKGKTLGRPSLDKSIVDEIPPLRQQGKSYRAIGKELGISEAAARKVMKGYNSPLG